MQRIEDGESHRAKYPKRVDLASWVGNQGHCSNRVQSTVKTLVLHSIFRICFRETSSGSFANWFPNIGTGSKTEGWLVCSNPGIFLTAKQTAGLLAQPHLMQS